MSFRGNHPTRVDEKGRLKMPADFRAELDEKYGKDTKYFITSKDGERAEIYPIAEWEAIEAKLQTLGSMHPARKKFIDLTNKYGSMAEMDGQGRLLIPMRIREEAGLKEEEVLVLGSQTYLEVANKARFEAKQEAEPMTAEEQAVLAALGI